MKAEFSYNDVLVAMNKGIAAGVSPDSVKEAMRTYCDSWNTNDIATRESLFADDVVFCDPMNSRTAKGLEALKGFWHASQKMPGAIQTQTHDCVACGNSGLLDFTISFTNPDASKVHLRVRDIFGFNASGKIISLEAYWDLASISPGA